MDVAALFAEHHRPLCRYLLRFTGDADLAADAAQEAFVRALDQRAISGSAKAWLYTVATNIARDTMRTTQRRARILFSMPDQAPIPSAPLAPDRSLDLAEQRASIQRALLTLSERERTALLLREEGLTQREIGEAMGISIGTTGSLIARALVKLGEQLDLEPGAE